MRHNADSSYRALLKEKIRLSKHTHPKIGVSWLAKQLGIQQSYLSRGLNHPKAHLNEDHFFLILDYLNLSEDDQYYLRLLRDFELSSSDKRREKLRLKILDFKTSQELKIENLKSKTLQPEEIFTLEPLLMILHVALHIPKYQKHWEQLADLLNINNRDMRENLHKLQRARLVELEQKNTQLRIKAIKESSIHFGKEHPLTKAHQALLKQICNAHLQSLKPSDKESFMVTLSSSQNFQKKYLEAQKRFLNELQKISSSEPNENTYQLNIEFFKWI